MSSDAEASLAFYLRTLAPALPAAERDWPFHVIPAGEAKERRWSLDFAWPAQRVVVEVEGWSHRAPGEGSRYVSDIAKYNTLTLAGWKLLRFTPGQIAGDPVGVVAIIEELVKLEGGQHGVAQTEANSGVEAAGGGRRV